MPALARGLKLIKGRNGLADEEAFKELKAAGLAHEEKDLVLLQLFAGENLVQSKSAVFPPPPPPKPAPLPLINHEVLRLLIVANGVTMDQARPYFAKALKAGSEPSDHDIEAACQSVGGGVHDGLISSGNNGGIERLTPGQANSPQGHASGWRNGAREGSQTNAWEGSVIYHFINVPVYPPSSSKGLQLNRHAAHSN